MRVCFVNALFPPDAHGGAENYVLRTAKALQARGHDVSVVTTRPYDGRDSLKPTRTTHEGVEVWRFFPLNLSQRGRGTGEHLLTKALWHAFDAGNPHAYASVGSVLDRFAPDVVHTNNLTGISTAVGRAVQGRNVRHVHTLHDYSLICPKSNLLRDFTAPDGELVVCENPPSPCRAHAGAKRRLLGNPDVVTGPSRHVIDVHRRHGFFEDTRCRRIQLGVDGIAAEATPPSDARSVLYVGKQLRAKGLDTLFRAAAELPDVDVHVCGVGPYADETERQAGRLPNLQYHGYVTDETLTRLRRETAVAVAPSIWMENSPLAIYESFAAGRPVVGSDIGGIPELVSDGERGALFDPEDADALVAAIERTLSGSRRLGRNALRWARTRTVERHVDRLVEECYVGERNGS